MAVGRLQAALAAATSEVTVAAANLNFDFTLVKYEAPTEYQPLGVLLSTNRKESAEHGSIHRLARQLGALFEDVCPPTPALLEAYGKRASEIAEASEKTSDQYTGTLFGDFKGIDGTSIWAAATSSKAALHVHLLASLLARMWSAPEAIAIWMELVAERRKSIATKLENGEQLKFSLAAAVGQSITRAELAAWDTSARAWLRTADEVFKRKQKQLELILKNIDLPVDKDSKVFSSVSRAWVTAIVTMDKLVQGMPQAIQDGAPLLGLSAWHLYPDITIFSPKVVEIKMNDTLVAAGGMISIGLGATPRASREDNGVYWSLSLAQLRHYGRPVKVERAMETGSRITFPQLNLVIFGIMLAEWQLSTTQSQLAADAIIATMDYLEHHKQGSRTDKRLFRLLRDSALAYSEREAGDSALNSKLIQLGRRRAKKFVHDSDRPQESTASPKFFSFLQPSVFMDALKDVESRVTFLRHVGKSLTVDEDSPDAFLIRYATNMTIDAVQPNTSPLDNDHKPFADSIDAYESSRSVDDMPDTYSTTPLTGQTWHGTKWGSISPDITLDTAEDVDHVIHHRWLPVQPSFFNIPEGERVTLDADARFRSWDFNVQIIGAEDPNAYTYDFVLGSPLDAALFVQRQASEKFNGLEITLENFIWCLEQNLIDPYRILSRLRFADSTSGGKLETTMRILAAVAAVYDDLPDTNLDIGILNRSLIETRWVRNIFPLENLLSAPTPVLNHGGKFAIIAYFESGFHDVDPTQLQNVIALSSTNSLFVCRPLLEDPHTSLEQSMGIRRIFGNIGKPGITFMLPPQEPMMREFDPNTWLMNNCHPFDGTTSRSFDSTSLHLSFTEYHVPLFDGSRGSQDHQISFLESVISVQDKGKWVADVDPLLLIRPPGQLRCLEKKITCQHSTERSQIADIVAVDSWDELLDIPEGVFVVRAGDNWVARLALTLVAYQRLQQISTAFAVTICPANVCWSCTKRSFRRHAFIY
ncbi:hypothetical protein DE146DRAFT_711785 [Phaeosphaeria sp. MPI-PUGE-AT-0046c]|nr:hypothetical protein DE146DRAFT_711785 [Phaeosphaeria sp. MPI-PUGE-AT-0046c]